MPVRDLGNFFSSRSLAEADPCRAAPQARKAGYFQTRFFLSGLGRAVFLGDGLAKIVERQLQSSFEIDLWFPAEQAPGFRNVGTSQFRVVLGQSFELDLAGGCGDGDHLPGAFENGELVRVPDVYRFVLG